MTASEVVQVLWDILEEYRAMELEDSPITWIRAFDGGRETDGFILGNVIK